MPVRAPIDRFLDKIVVPAEGTCWLWGGAIGPKGYGAFGLGPRGSGCVRPHRFAYEHFVGPIPDGLQIDHLCRVRHCVNPDHLEVVTNAENTRRGLKGRLVIECAQGHPYNEANTGRKTPSGRRYCRACARERMRAKRSAGVRRREVVT